jgi:hypothetical protein
MASTTACWGTGVSNAMARWGSPDAISASARTTVTSSESQSDPPAVAASSRAARSRVAASGAPTAIESFASSSTWLVASQASCPRTTSSSVSR